MRTTRDQRRSVSWRVSASNKGIFGSLRAKRTNGIWHAPAKDWGLVWTTWGLFAVPPKCPSYSAHSRNKPPSDCEHFGRCSNPPKWGPAGRRLASEPPRRHCFASEPDSLRTWTCVTKAAAYLRQLRSTVTTHGQGRIKACSHMQRSATSIALTSL